MLARTVREYEYLDRRLGVALSFVAVFLPGEAAEIEWRDVVLGHQPVTQEAKSTAAFGGIGTSLWRASRSRASSA